jgi:hypothetical protein
MNVFARLMPHLLPTAMGFECTVQASPTSQGVGCVLQPYACFIEHVNIYLQSIFDYISVKLRTHF